MTVGPIPLYMHKLPVILDTRAGSNFSRESHLTLFLKTQVVHVSGTTEIYNGSFNSFRSIGSTMLYIRVGRVTERVSFVVCKRLALLA